MIAGNTEQLSERLKIERTRLGLSQVAFSEACGVNRGTLATWEKGEQTPTAAVLALMAKLGVDVLYVVTGHHTPKTSTALTPDEAELLNLYNKADTQGRDAVQAVAALAGRTGGSAPKGGNIVSIGGNVQQAIGGDASFSAPISFGKNNK